jgi:hypothetical protein
MQGHLGGQSLRIVMSAQEFAGRNLPWRNRLPSNSALKWTGSGGCRGADRLPLSNRFCCARRVTVSPRTQSPLKCPTVSGAGEPLASAGDQRCSGARSVYRVA